MTASTIQQPQVGKDYRDQWKRWMLMRLGHPVVKVEVTNANLDIAIDEAVKRFSQWVPGTEKIAIFDAVVDQTTYDLTELVPDYISVRDVIYNPNYTDNFITSYAGGSITTDFQFGVGSSISYYHGTMTSMTDYAIINLYTEMYRRITGREGTWQIIGTKLLLTPAPKAPLKVGMIYQSMSIDTDVRRDEWIKEWALTEIKMSLGAARRKYQGIPGPRGDTITMDGEALITEAREDQTTLRERLNEYREPYLVSTY